MTIRTLLLAAACLAELSVPLVAQQALPAPARGPRTAPTTAPAPPGQPAPPTPRREGQPTTAPAPAGQPAPPTPRREGQPTTAPAPAGQPAPPTPRREGQPINVKVEVTITDLGGGGTQALKKTVTVVTGDNMTGFIRSMANYASIGSVPLNLDIEPQILTDNRIRVRVNLQYTLPGETKLPADNSLALRKTEIHENLALILENGKSLIVAQSADPVGDRQVTVEVKATVLR
jgi:outer membrane biosynthesis protein TonB